MVKRLVILTCIFLITFGCQSCIRRERTVMFDYSFGIGPKEGENPKNVMVYLPFPHHEGKPFTKILKALKKRYNEYERESIPGVTLDLVETKYGIMLKIHIPLLKVGFGIDVHSSLRESISLPPPSTRYLLNPRVNVRKVTYHQADQGPIKGLMSDTYAFVSYQDGTGLSLGADYEVVDRTPPPFPFIWMHRSGGNYSASVNQKPFQETYQRQYINEKGWIKLPVYEIGYGSR